MKEVIPHRIVIDEKEIVYEKTTASKFNHFVVNIEPKLASKIPASNTHFEQYVKYEGLILERIAFCDEELKNALSSLKSNKSPGHDGISSNLIKCFRKIIWRFKTRVKFFNPSRCLSRKHEDYACCSNF